MKEHLANSIQALINGNKDEAKQHFSTYIKGKSKLMFEERVTDTDFVKVHCEDCGEEATTTNNIANGKRWTCPKCGGHEFVRDE